MKAATEALQFNCVGLLISIHAAREGGDAVRVCMVSLDELISIHAAREGGDYFSEASTYPQSYFNPRRP